MTNWDLIIGSMFGLFQGLLFPVVIRLGYHFLCGIMAKVALFSKNPSFLIIFCGAGSALFGGLFLVSIVLVGGFIGSWNEFVVGWKFGFLVGAVVVTIIHKRKGRKLR